MKQVKSEELLTNLEKQVESHLVIAISRFQNLKDSELLSASATGGWSIAQCLEHLNLYSNYYLPEIEKGIAKNNEPAAGNFKSTWFGTYFTNMMNPDTGKKKYKAFKDYRPPQKLDAHEVIASFITNQEKLLKLIRAAHSKNLNKIKIPISIARWLTIRLGDTFQFLIAHNERHVRQAQRNLS